MSPQRQEEGNIPPLSETSFRRQRAAPVAFEDITVIHNFHKSVLSIHNGDQARVHGIQYKNITVEDAQMGEGDAANDNFLIDLVVAESRWPTSAERGSIENIGFKNIRVLGGKFPPSRIMRYDGMHGVMGITIENLFILGRHVKTLPEGKFNILQAVEDVRLR